MTAVLAFIYRLIGFGGCAFIALYIYDWGIPGAARIPYLSSIPIVGDLTTGRAHTYAADQVKIATADMVTRFERDALAAQLAKERQDRLNAEVAATEAKKRADIARMAEQKAQADLDKRILEDTGDDGAVWTEGDLRWLGR